MMTELSSGYSAEIDNVDKESWNNILADFLDANIYQAWSYEAVRSGEKKFSHLVLKKDGVIVAAAQLKIVRMPFARFGAAYIRWGPMWRPRGKALDPDALSQILRAIRNEYACGRRLMVRILPLLFDDQSEIFNPLLTREGFKRSYIEDTQRTILVPLDNPVEELRKGLHRKWRYNLTRAEKNRLEVVEGSDDRLFGLFIEIYEQMQNRKQFVEGASVREFRMMQRDLPDQFKMKIFIALSDNIPAAGVVCSCVGDMGIYLFGGTSNAGLHTYGSYLLQWKALGWLKEKGAAWYNLHGINPQTNPGTYAFKSGLCGKNGNELKYLGYYDTHESLATCVVFLAATHARKAYRRGKFALNRFKRVLAMETIQKRLKDALS